MAKTSIVAVRIEDGLKKQIKTLAEKDERKISEIINFALREYIERRMKNQAAPGFFDGPLTQKTK
jgi:predicted transcriptional regulator